MAYRIFKTLFFTAVLIGISCNTGFGDSIDLAIKSGLFNYREPNANVAYTGMIHGIQGTYQKSFSAWSVRVRSELMSGAMNYKGHLNIHQVAGSSSTLSGDMSAISHRSGSTSPSTSP